MSAPASRVPAEHTDDIESVKHDAIEQLCSDLGQIVDFFGPGAAEGVKAAMETDAFNMKSLDMLQQKLMQQGRVKEAEQVAHQSCNILDTSMDQLVKLRRHISDIAELLLELSACAEDSNDSVSVLQEIQGTASEAFVVAAKGKKAYADATVRLSALCTQFQAEYEGAKKEVAETDKCSKEHADKASRHSKWAVAHGGLGLVSTGASCAAGTATGGALAMTSLASLAESTGGAWDATNVAGGVTMHAAAGGSASATCGVGMAGYVINAGARAAMFLGPTGLAIGVGMTILFGGLAVYNWKESCHQAQAAIEEHQAQDDALRKNKLQAEGLEGAKDAADAACKTKRLMDYHRKMWAGISMSADAAESTLKSLARAGSRSTTGKLFTERMNKFGEQLLHFVRAIDSYMFWLSKTGYFPPNFNVRSIMGTQTYNQLQAETKHQIETSP